MSVPRTHAGFTLIELMIVVAIIAILAAIALPSYHDYTVRAQVNECGVVAAGAKAAVTESLSNRGVLPADNDAAGLAAAADITGKYVSSVTVNDGEIACLYSSVAPFRANAGINGQRLLLTPNYVSSDGSVTWTCSSTTILQKFLSAACRTNLN